MGLTLHLGVIDQLYATPPSSNAHKATKGKKRRARRKRGKGRGIVSTGDVAGWLEERYGVMQHFFDAHSQDIADALASDVAGSLENLLAGGPGQLSLATATGAIEAMFKKAISEREFDRLGIPGVPTQAAMSGVNHRLKRPYVKRAPRPSFRDSGLYMASFRAWVEE